MKAISSMATRQVLAELVAASGFAIEVESVGGVDAAARVASGEAFDLVFLASGALAKLAADGHVHAVTPLMLSQTAVAVGSESSAPAERPEGAAFADAAGLQQALRAAGRIGYSTGPSGTALVQLIDTWGLTAELGDRLVQARPGVPVARLLADGEVDLGFQQLSELVGQQGVQILGVMPEDCAIDTVFGGAVAATATDATAAAQALAFMASEDAAPVKQAHNFGLVPAASGS